MRKQSLKRCLIGLCVLIFIVLANNDLKCDASETVDREIVILIDMSGSMNNAWAEAKRWALEIGMLFNTDVKFNLLGFGGENDAVESIYEGVLAAPDDQEYEEKVNLLESRYTEYTDQKGALDKAIEIMENSDARMKCIIMLSDGLLDYQKDNKEAEAATNFKIQVEEFAKKDNQKIYLVQFPSNDKNGKDVFGGFGKKILFRSDADPEKILSNEVLLNEVTQELLDALDFSGEQDTLAFKNNQTEFVLETNCDRVLLTIKPSKGSMRDDAIDTVVVMSQTAKVEPRGYSMSEDQLLLYYDQLDAGKYMLTMPEGHWLGYITYMEKMEIQSINLSILQDNIEITPSQDGAYILEKGKNYRLKVKVEAPKADQLNALDDATTTCILTRTGNGNETKNTNSKKMSSGAYSFPLDLQYDSDNDEMGYQCYVEIRYGNMSEQSGKITIISRDTTEPVKTTTISKCVYTKEKINVCGDLQISSGEDYILYIAMEEKTNTVDSVNKFIEDEYEFQNGIINFKKEGTYVISAKINKGDEKKDGAVSCEYVVTKKSFWQKLIEMFSEIKL